MTLCEKLTLFEFNVFLSIKWYIKQSNYITKKELTKKKIRFLFFFEKLNFLINPVIGFYGSLTLMNDYIFRISTKFTIKWYAVSILFLVDSSFLTFLLHFQ